MRLLWSVSADEDLRRIEDFISARDPRAAECLSNRIVAVADRLPKRPAIHRPGRLPGTREAVVHPNYILIYRVEADTVLILAVLRARQRYP